MEPSSSDVVTGGCVRSTHIGLSVKAATFISSYKGCASFVACTAMRGKDVGPQVQVVHCYRAARLMSSLNLLAKFHGFSSQIIVRTSNSLPVEITKDLIWHVQ